MKGRKLTVLAAVLMLSASAVYAVSDFLERWRVPAKVVVGHEYFEVVSTDGVSLSSLDFGNLYEAGQTVTLEFIVRNKGKADIDLRAKIYKIITKHVKRDITLLTIDSNKLRDEDIHLYSLTLNIAADAIIICDPQGLLNNFISKGRKIIKKAKLVRYRTPDGKYGWMRKDGKPITLVEV